MLPRKSRKENPQKLTQLSSRSHPRHLVGKRTAQKDTTTDTTSDSQANSNLPNRRPPASPTPNNHFYLFLYLYTTRTTTNNNTPHPKPPKNQNRRAALGRPAMKTTGGGPNSPRPTNPRPQLRSGSPDKQSTNNKKQNTNEKQSGQPDRRTGGHNAKTTHKTNRHNNNVTSQKKIKEHPRGDKTEMPPRDGQQ